MEEETGAGLLRRLQQRCDAVHLDVVTGPDGGGYREWVMHYARIGSNCPFPDCRILSGNKGDFPRVLRLSPVILRAYALRRFARLIPIIENARFVE
jgi:hypothetical protein